MSTTVTPSSANRTPTFVSRCAMNATDIRTAAPTTRTRSGADAIKNATASTAGTTGSARTSRRQPLDQTSSEPSFNRRVRNEASSMTSIPPRAPYRHGWASNWSRGSGGALFLEEPLDQPTGDRGHRESMGGRPLAEPPVKFGREPDQEGLVHLPGRRDDGIGRGDTEGLCRMRGEARVYGSRSGRSPEQRGQHLVLLALRERSHGLQDQPAEPVSVRSLRRHRSSNERSRQISGAISDDISGWSARQGSGSDQRSTSPTTKK